MMRLGFPSLQWILKHGGRHQILKQIASLVGAVFPTVALINFASLLPSLRFLISGAPSFALLFRGLPALGTVLKVVGSGGLSSSTSSQGPLGIFHPSFLHGGFLWSAIGRSGLYSCALKRASLSCSLVCPRMWMMLVEIILLSSLLMIGLIEIPPSALSDPIFRSLIAE